MMDHPGMESGYGPHMGSTPAVPMAPSGPLPPGPPMAPPPGYPSQGAPPVAHQGMGSHMPAMSSGGYSQQKPPGPLSSIQLKFLSAQIKAYRCLARNAVIPDQIRSIILSHASSVSGTAAASSTPPPQSSASSSPAPGGTAPAPPNQPPSSVSPSPAAQQQNTSTATDNQKPSIPTSSAGTESTQTPPLPPPTSKSDETKVESGTQSNSAPVKPQTQIRQAKLAPPAKPRGLDPDIILREREAR